MDFKSRLKQIRIRYNPDSAATFAKSLGLNQPTYARYESGETKPSYDLICSLNKVYDINLNWLISGDGEMFKFKNSLINQKNEFVDDNFSQWGRRLKQIQDKNGMLDWEIAKLLNVSEKRYMALVLGKEEPQVKFLNKTKENFVVDIDWLLYGKNIL